MNLLPIHRYELDTDLDSMWVKKRISNNIREPMTFANPFDKSLYDKDFVGVFEGDNFKITRVLKYGEHLKSIIVGKIVEKEHGAKIMLTIRLPIIIYIFLFIFWILAPIMFAASKIPYGLNLTMFTLRNIKIIFYSMFNLHSFFSNLVIILLGYLGIIVAPLNYQEKETIELLKKLIH